MFDHTEDRDYFDLVLRDIGGVDANSHLFDLRDPDLKRCGHCRRYGCFPATDLQGSGVA